MSRQLFRLDWERGISYDVGMKKLRRNQVMHKAMAAFVALVCISSWPARRLWAQENSPFMWKKLSEFSTQKERYLYIFDLDASGAFTTKRWSELQPLFDLGAREHEFEDGKRVVASLLEQPSIEGRAPDDIGGRAYVGWRIVFELDSKGVIRRYEMSNSHK